MSSFSRDRLCWCARTWIFYAALTRLQFFTWKRFSPILHVNFWSFPVKLTNKFSFTNFLYTFYSFILVRFSSFFSGFFFYSLSCYPNWVKALKLWFLKSSWNFWSECRNSQPTPITKPTQFNYNLHTSERGQTHPQTFSFYIQSKEFYIYMNE